MVAGRVIQVLGVLALAARAFAAHPIPESERWATITHAGNEPYTWDPPGVVTFRSAGSVDHEYQISRTEVTGTEWFEFVQAYTPYAQQTDVTDAEFLSTSVGLYTEGGYFLVPGRENKAVEIGWRFAARYVNWLHNDKRPEEAAFQSGVYDTSTFGIFSSPTNAGFTDQIAHEPDARYWIPTADEWVKAAHFDPNRFGPDMPGYWLYSNSSDAAQYPPGLPETGGQTSTGGRFAFPLPDVAAYRDVQSPWGLWDTSGGYSEWSETADVNQFDPTLSQGRVIKGSSWRIPYFTSDGIPQDRVDASQSVDSPTTLHALRLARAVPGAGSVWVVVCAVPFLIRRRRQSHDATHTNLVDRVCG
ncbi:MAG: SUMF1/EgtB/PvdO family nonheme iron enzyme [Phycisphaerae bacterium]|nr:SUMF1/EgtB/PvdO family nonheme iron enzyme [Phycisphaerae bacterium]